MQTQTAVNQDVTTNRRNMKDLREIDALIAGKVMVWHRKTYADINPNQYRELSEEWNEKGKEQTDYWYNAEGDESECAQDNGSYEDSEYSWKPTEVPADSKMLRAKLSEKWDWLMGYSEDDEETFGFALYPKGSMMQAGLELKPEFTAESHTEEMAIVLCACQAFGIEV